MGQKLTPKQKKFCEYYRMTGNATESAIKAGYNKNRANEQGYQNLQLPYIQEYIKKISEKSDNERIAKIEEVQEFWTSVMRDTKARVCDRLKASEFIAKTAGSFITKTEISGKIETKSESKINLLTTEELKAIVDNIKSDGND